MSGRQFRKLLLLAALAGVGYWIYTERPTLPGIVDSITRPLFGSKAAVKASESNRINEDAGTAVAEQSDVQVAALREGMSRSEVNEILGSPDSIQTEKQDKVVSVRCTYRHARRVLIFQDGRLVSISVL